MNFLSRFFRPSRKTIRATAMIAAAVVLLELVALAAWWSYSQSRLGRIEAPTTIVVGSADAVVPAAATRKLATQIGRARLIEIERGGHMLPAQYPDRLAEIVLASASVRQGSDAPGLAVEQSTGRQVR